ncbi:MAG: HNH endonuclease [Deltaproteobacteria bacterium]|nr:HNH endonuclease [Deltaproteobacteria bacterium]
MTSRLDPATIVRLEKVATDNGFDRVLPREGEFLAFGSNKAPLRLWLSTFGDALYLAALSQAHVAEALGAHGTPLAAPLPPGAAAGRSVTTIPALHHLVRRAFQLSRSLPDAILHTFETQTAALPRATEAERLVVERVGQDLFRERLLDYWEGRCAVTGLAVRDLLRASHIKPWASCASDAERLDVFNGLLLAPHLDAAFDRGFITVGDDGAVILSSTLSEDDRRILRLDQPLRVRALDARHRAYLPWHHEKVFTP